MDGTDISTVDAAFTSALETFCRNLALLTDTISYAKVLRLLLDTAGVADVTNFTLCGSDKSIILSEAAIPVIGTITLTKAVTST